MGATLDMLSRQWDVAYANEDFDTANKLSAAMRKIEDLPVKVPAVCSWQNTDTCKMCVAPEAGKCPVIAVDVAA